ncbi:MAG: S-layer homology domain-containing protein [Trueperaceae bacterium]
MRKLFTGFAFVALLALAALASAQIAPGPATPDQIQRALNESPGPWADEAIELLVSQGLYIGYPDGTFGWRNNISRAEFAVVLARLINTYGLSSFNPDEQMVLRNALDELRGDLADVLARQDGQQQQIDELRSTQAALESMIMAFEGLDVGGDIQALSDRLAAVEAALEDVRADINALPVVPVAPTAQTDPGDWEGLNARLGAAESERVSLANELAALRSEQQTLASRVAALEAQQQSAPADADGATVITVPADGASAAMVNELRGRVDQLDTRLQRADEDVAAMRAEIAANTTRIDRLERSLLPDRAAFYVNLAIFGTDPNFDLFAKATVGHDSLFGAVGLRASFEYSLGAMPHNVSAAFTYRMSSGSTDGYFGLGGGVTIDDPMAPFGEILAGMNFRMTRTLGMYLEGRYRPFFDGATPASAGLGAGISVRF